MLERLAASKRASIAIIALCQVGAMALWFSASAVVPALVAEYGLSTFMQAALTSGVQAGFVVGCLASAILGLPDRVEPRRLIAASALLGAIANALLLVVDPSTFVAPLLRIVTGIAMAGVYPVGMKLAATWARGDMGLMVGILVGALTLGSAMSPGRRDEVGYTIASSRCDASRPSTPGSTPSTVRTMLSPLSRPRSTPIRPCSSVIRPCSSVMTTRSTPRAPGATSRGPGRRTRRT